jgi:hypothetical protein
MPRDLEISFREGAPLAAYIYLRGPIGDGAVTRSEEREGLVVDFAADGTPLGIEIVHPAGFTLEALNTVLASLGEPVAGPREVGPLLAA